MQQPNPPNKNPGGGQAISGGSTKVIYPEKFANVNQRGMRLNKGLEHLAIWNDAVERHNNFLATLRSLGNGETPC